MPDARHTLEPSLLDEVFPFHFALDQRLRVLQAGPSLRKLHPNGLVGLEFAELFTVDTPKVATNFEALVARPRDLFLLASTTCSGLLLRGQVLHEPGSEYLFFVGSPWMTQTTAIAALGLTMGDFAVSDGVVDYLLLLQTQASALDEARALTTRLHDTAEQLSHQAFHDPLTGLPNRARLLSQLRSAMDPSAPTGGHAAVIMLDLDDFKAVNDSYGHSAGDEVLQVVAERLSAVARESDLVARLDGDQFALVPSTRPPGPRLDEDGATKIAERLLMALGGSLPLQSWPGITVPLSASIGIAYSGNDADTAEDLLRNADLAMYAAKARGKNRFQHYERELRAKALGRLELAKQLRDAVAAGEFRLAFQPVLRLEDDRFTGAEALVRWQHPVRGLLQPIDFIELAEQTGLIVPIGAWVLDQACRELRLWQAAHTGREPLGVAVNLSAQQLRPELVNTVATALARHGIDPGALTLEVTEGLITEHVPVARQTLRSLKKLGVWLAIDDFGTGHSSLGRLRDFEFDVLKIDRRFVSDLDSGDTTLVTTQITLANGLGLGIVAEGVETEAELAYLRAAGCGEVQGFLIARPLAAADVRPLLSGQAKWTAPRGGGDLVPAVPLHR